MLITLIVPSPLAKGSEEWVKRDARSEEEERALKGLQVPLWHAPHMTLACSSHTLHMTFARDGPRMALT